MTTDSLKCRLGFHNTEPFTLEDKSGLFFACTRCGLIKEYKSKGINPRSFEEWIDILETKGE